MLHTALWGPKVGDWTLDQAKRRLVDNPSVVRDLQSVLEFRLNHSLQSKIPVSSQFDPLSIHASYTRDEILIALGHWSFERRPSQREGVLHLKDRKLDVFFVTLQKSEDEYSPTTMYDDFAGFVSLADTEQHVGAIVDRAAVHKAWRDGIYATVVCPRDQGFVVWPIGPVPLPRSVPVRQPHRQSPDQYHLETKASGPGRALPIHGPADCRVALER
jgi:hypothetical protein